MERVLYARDPLFNQAFRQMSDVISPEPAPIPTTGQALAAGAIEIIGHRAGGRQGVRARRQDRGPRLLPGPAADRDHLPVPAGGLAGDRGPDRPRPGDRDPRRPCGPRPRGPTRTERWRPEDAVRERFAIAIPADWTADRMVVGLVASEGPSGNKARATGAAPANDPTIAVLGVLPVTIPAGSLAPAQP